MSRKRADLAQLLAALDPEAAAAQRHLQLIALLDWVRGDSQVVQAATDRVAQLVQAAEQSADTRTRLQAWWAALTGQLDITTLLADFGFAQRSSMASELAERLRHKLLPTSPDTLDASELFMLALPHEFDARWLAALDAALLERLLAVLIPAQEDSSAGASAWQRDLLDAISYCAGQILATGFAPELRLRMSEATRQAQPFHVLLRDTESLRVEVLHPLRTDDRLQEAV